MSAAIAILIPTINRAGMLEALVDNIHEVTDAPHRVYLIIEDTDRDSINVAKRLDVRYVLGTFGSCSKAMNAGYWASTEPFVVVANDDCVFHSGWDTAALKKFNPITHIVGMNDGYGDCKCFTMSRRKFIEEHSGVYDQPNTLFHPGYQSQGPDTEFAFYAMLRNVWSFAPDAIVQHLNWRVGADPNHPNYLKARDTIVEDLDEYNRRWPEWDPERVMPPPVPTVESR